MIAQANSHYREAIARGLMQVSIRSRRGKLVELPDGQSVVEFLNCSYLGLDTHPALITGAQEAVDEWGVHLCCARSRFTIEPNRLLEEELSSLFKGRAITFPSVTSAHMSALPLLAAGALSPRGGRPVRLVFDRFAHASMQVLKPILAVEAEITTIAHNDLDQLLSEVQVAKSKGQELVFLADGVYSMGGVSPIRKLLALAHEHDFYLYIDDAHGTSILGQRGEGFALACTGPELSERMILTFSLAKGFGCNGGGILVPHTFQEEAIRTYGVTYGFSAPLDFAVVGAALASIKLHRDGTVAALQRALWDRVREFTGLGLEQRFVSPIGMVKASDTEQCLNLGSELKRRGYFVSVVFFPIVAQENAQLRICLSAEHSSEQLAGLRAALGELGKEAVFASGSLDSTEFEAFL